MKKLLIITTIILVPISSILHAQSNTMYYMTGLPQAYYLNPASQPFSSFFLGVPVVNGLYFEGFNNSFGISDLLWNDPNSDEVIHPLHSPEALDAFFDKLPDVNTLGINLTITPLSFGFRIKDMYFTFDAALRNRVSMSIAKGFLELTDGLKPNSVYDLSGIGFHMSSYVEYALGISRNFNDELWVGIRPKLLMGIAYIASEQNNILLDISNEALLFDSEIALRMALPGVNIPTNENGNLDLGGKYESDAMPGSLFANKGFGIDIGAHYKPTEDLTLSFSAIDIGSITWKNYNHTSTLTSNFEFTGVEYSLEGDSSNFFESFTDTLRNRFETSGSDAAFKTTLGTKLFIGGSYALLPSVDAGILVRMDLPYLHDDFKANVILHANWHPSTIFSYGLSYSPLENNGSTIGTTLFLRLGPFSWYTAVDYRALRYTKYTYNSLPVFVAPDHRSQFNVRLGMNLVIGNNKIRKLRKDKPMYYTEDNQ